MAAATDRAGRALRLVPHLSRRGARSYAGIGADTRASPPGAEVHRRNAGQAADWRLSMRIGTTRAKRFARWPPALAITLVLRARSNHVPSCNSPPNQSMTGPAFTRSMTQSEFLQDFRQTAARDHAWLHHSGTPRPGEEPSRKAFGP